MEARCYFLRLLSPCTAICLCHPAHTNPARRARFHPPTYYCTSLRSYIRQLAGGFCSFALSLLFLHSFLSVCSIPSIFSALPFPSLTLSCLLLTLCCHVFHPHLFTALYFLHAPFLPPLFFFLLLLQTLSLLQFSFLPICSSLQALQALQRQPNAAQYFQQLMLQQQINNAAQLQNLAAVQQVKVCANFTLFLPSKGSYKHPARVVCEAQRKTIVRNKTIHDDAVRALHKTD